MSKKIFTLLLLAVFVLAQFSMASALGAVTTATTTLTSTQTFVAAAATGATIDFDWSVTGLAVAPGTTYYVDIYARNNASTYVVAAECDAVAQINGGGAGSGSYTFTFAGVTANTDTWDFVIAVNTVGSCGDAATLDGVAAPNYVHQAYVDGAPLTGFTAAPPAKVANLVACNTFEFWGYANDKNAPVYSGFGGWNKAVTGTFAAPAPIGADNDFLKWEYTFPATATGAWSFVVSPKDAAGNLPVAAPITLYTKAAPGPIAAELADCASFTDSASVYARYMASAGLISGFADGTFGAAGNLSRAEAATLIEKSNGYKDTSLGFGTPPTAGSACDFADVADTDWFAPWVWKACADGFMNGVGGGNFDPNNLLTRGQIVTILNNAYTHGAPAEYLGFPGNVYNTYWAALVPFRSAAWNDVSIGAFYAIPVQRAYGSLIAEATAYDATTGVGTFSPDVAVTRGEFAEMLYRAFSYGKGTY